jgi:hypothetical protein
MCAPRLLVFVAVILSLLCGCLDRDDRTRDEPPALRESAMENAAGSTQPSEDARSVRAPSTSAVRSDGLIVNSEVLTVADILEPIRPRLEKLAETMPAELYERRAAELIRQRLVQSVAQLLIYRRANLNMNKDVEPQIKKSIDKMERERINREFGGRETEYEKSLLGSGKTREDVRQNLRRALFVDGYLRETLLPMVDDPRKPELWKTYEAYKEQNSKPERRELFLIHVPIRHFYDSDVLRKRRPATSDEQAAAWRQSEEAINAAQAALAAGAPFEDVAKQHSKGVHQKDGGAWGFISSPLMAEWAVPSKQLFEMKENTVSDVIKTAQGYFIVKLGKIDGGKVKSFKDAQPELIGLLKDRQFQRLRGEFLQKELERSTIGSLDAFAAEVFRASPRPRRN